MADAMRMRNATWLHPIRGIVYFVSHPFLWPLFRSRLLPIMLLSGFAYTLLFVFTYLPQVAFLAIFQGSGAWVNGAVLVLGEGAAIVALLFEAFFVDETQVDVFDAVLLNEGLEPLISRESPPSGRRQPGQEAGQAHDERGLCAIFVAANRRVCHSPAAQFRACGRGANVPGLDWIPSRPVPPLEIFPAYGPHQRREEAVCAESTAEIYSVRDGGLDFTIDTLSFNVFSTYQRGWLSPVGSGDGEEETVP